MPSPPRISGASLRALARFARTGPGARTIYRALRGDLRVSELSALPEGLRGDLLFDLTPLAGRPPRGEGREGADLPLPPPGWAPSSAAIAAAYASGKATPNDVVEACLAAARDLAARTPSHGPMLAYDEPRARADAASSLDRHRRGAALGPLDGVPFVVKEQVAVKGLPRQDGTAFMSDAPMEADATSVARLRERGAIVIGTTVMTEFGMSPLGQNRLRTMPRNPHAPGHLAGGSSTGSGVAVGTGLVPFAIGCDGGGSIRTPASWSGVFGIKPTWGRVSRGGALCGGSVSHVGPIAGSTLDLARSLERMAGPDDDDRETRATSPMEAGSLERALRRGVKGLRIGIEEREWGDASSAVERAGREALRVLEREGAVLVPVRLELARFAVGIGTLSIGPEARSLNRRDCERFLDRMGYDSQISFAALGCVSSTDFLDAQRLRTGFRAELAHAFGDLDLLALPTTADTAPRVSDAEMESGFVDGRALARACRYAFHANLSGLPAGTAPVGLDADGVPIGFQLVGDAWDEATVLAGLAHLERVGLSRPPKPKVHVSIL
jgi:aspartyl-tRNA(Asn)/glutamyl-tRNA(Gln) amidotransferase subunit A